MYRLKQREAKVKADEEARQAALKERIQTLLAEKERQTHKYMRQTRKRDDLGASVVDEDGVDEAGDVSISTHGNTSRHQHQQQIIHTHSDSHAASEDVSIALPLPSDMPPHQSIYSGEDYVDLTTEHIRVNTPDCNNYGGDNDADDDSLDEGSSSLEALQANINNNTNNGNKHMRNNNDTNTTVVNLSSTKVVSTAPIVVPEPEPMFQMVMSIDDLRRKRPKQLLPSPHSSAYTPDNSIYMPHSSTHLSATSAKSTSVPLSYLTTTIIPTRTHSIDPTTSSTASRRPSTHQGRLSTDSSTFLSPSTALNIHQSPPYIPHTSSVSVRSSRDQATTHSSTNTYTDTLQTSPSLTLHIPPDPTVDPTSPPSPSNLHSVSQLASTSTYSNGTRIDLTLGSKPKNKKGFRRLVPIPLRPYQPV